MSPTITETFEVATTQAPSSQFSRRHQTSTTLPTGEDGADAYNKYPTSRKVAMLCTASWISLAATFSSTSLFPAVPEIAQEFGTTGEVINISNAGILCAMGMSSFIWAPMSNILGRNTAYKWAIFVFLVCSIGAAVAPDMKTFIALRCLAGFEATFFMAAGQGLLADVFHPSTRGTAVGFFMSGTVSGPALGG
jgi:MFS family permease